jgi:hypothetical protein
VLSYFCWHCYGQNRVARGRCEHCGEEIAPPADTAFDDQLLWALTHPLPDRRLLAIRAVASRRLQAGRDTLRALVADTDPYLAAAALEALVALDGAGAHRVLLERLRREGAAPVRAAARELLGPEPD